MDNKTKEHIESLYNIVKAQNKYIESLEIALSVKPKVKYIRVEDDTYKTNSVKLFSKYQNDLDTKDKEIELLKQEVECLKNGYIHIPIDVKA